MNARDISRRLAALEAPIDGQQLCVALRRVQAGENVDDMPPALASAACRLATDLAAMATADGIAIQIAP